MSDQNYQVAIVQHGICSLPESRVLDLDSAESIKTLTDEIDRGFRWMADLAKIEISIGTEQEVVALIRWEDEDSEPLLEWA